jgi:hypothetical protein
MARTRRRARMRQDTVHREQLHELGQAGVFRQHEVKDSQLPETYTVFGTIDSAGLATLDKVATAGVADGSEDGKPLTDVAIKSVQVG